MLRIRDVHPGSEFTRLDSIISMSLIAYHVDIVLVLLLIYSLLTLIDRCLMTMINNNSLLNLSIELMCEYCAGGDGSEEPGLQSHPDGGQTPQTAPGSIRYHQCWGSGSSGSACFWASRIR
jgi:hypothetical protein